MSKLGTGRYARVMQVNRKTDGKLCAIKFQMTKTPNDILALQNEIGIMKLCSSTHVCQIYEFFHFKDRIWIIMELMDGGSLG